MDGFTMISSKLLKTQYRDVNPAKTNDKARFAVVFKNQKEKANSDKEKKQKNNIINRGVISKSSYLRFEKSKIIKLINARDHAPRSNVTSQNQKQIFKQLLLKDKILMNLNFKYSERTLADILNQNHQLESDFVENINNDEYDNLNLNDSKFHDDFDYEVSELHIDDSQLQSGQINVFLKNSFLGSAEFICQRHENHTISFHILLENNISEEDYVPHLNFLINDLKDAGIEISGPTIECKNNIKNNRLGFSSKYKRLLIQKNMLA